MDSDATKITDWYCDDIRITHTLSKFERRDTYSVSRNNDVVRLHFGLTGDYCFSHKQLNRSFDLIGGHHNIMYSQGFDMTFENKSRKIETFGVQFPKELFVQFTQNASDNLKRFSEKILEGKAALLSEKWGSIDPAIEQVIRQIVRCKYDNSLQQLFLLSKSIELLVLSAEAYNRAKQQKEVLLKNKADKEKILAVRDLINERLTSPPNLSEISRTIGLNEYKLKRGFKETFQTTVFGYLTDQRLNLANQYLADTQKTSAEIAFELGYKTPQHFNNAFKKKFGVTPNSVRKNP